MKVYVHENGIMIVGKAWEVRQKLKENLHSYVLLKDWTNSVFRDKPTLKVCDKNAPSIQLK